jgi:hypothetical protein
VLRDSAASVLSDEVYERLLDEAGVALLSGTAFGPAGENHLRLSYATSRERLAEGLERMRVFLGSIFVRVVVTSVLLARLARHRCILGSCVGSGYMGGQP